LLTASKNVMAVYYCSIRVTDYSTDFTLQELSNESGSGIALVTLNSEYYKWDFWFWNCKPLAKMINFIQ